MTDLSVAGGVCDDRFLKIIDVLPSFALIYVQLFYYTKNRIKLRFFTADVHLTVQKSCMSYKGVNT